MTSQLLNRAIAILTSILLVYAGIWIGRATMKRQGFHIPHVTTSPAVHNTLDRQITRSRSSFFNSASRVPGLTRIIAPTRVEALSSARNARQRRWAIQSGSTVARTARTSPQQQTQILHRRIVDAASPTRAQRSSGGRDMATPPRSSRLPALRATPNPTRNRRTSAWSADLLARTGLRGEDAVVRIAYDAVLQEQRALESAQRRYLFVVPDSGHGNRALAVRGALALAIGTGRVLIVDPGQSSPLFPLLYADPVYPWRQPFRSLLLDGGRTGGRAELRDVKSSVMSLQSSKFKCWVQSLNFRQCRLRGARLLRVVTNHPLFWLIRRTPDVQEGLRMRLAAACDVIYTARGNATVRLWRDITPDSVVGLPVSMDTDDLALFRDDSRGCVARVSLMLPTLLSSLILSKPQPLLERAVDGAKRTVRWQEASLRVGLQVRSFVDRSKPTPALPQFWECAVRRFVEWRTATGRAGVRPESTLFFLSSDSLTVRDSARSAFAAYGRVAWLDPPVRRGARRFVHTTKLGGRHEDAVLMSSVMADWLLLAECDLIVGTPRSSFGFSSSGVRPGGVPMIRAALDGSECHEAALYVDRWDERQGQLDEASLMLP